MSKRGDLCSPRRHVVFKLGRLALWDAGRRSSRLSLTVRRAPGRVRLGLQGVARAAKTIARAAIMMMMASAQVEATADVTVFHVMIWPSITGSVVFC
ncbi:hypothetical protein FKP32DRAFT_1596905 [Trametes sanguinea]|nr:hypothetical protein FKP32DRAFT_1596905 [Trametes sanguinea]